MFLIGVKSEIMNGTFNTLKVSNGDLEIRFSCAYYGRRIRETINNLGVKCDDESKEQIKSRFSGHAIKFNELKNAIVSDDGRYYATLKYLPPNQF